MYKLIHHVLYWVEINFVSAGRGKISNLNLNLTLTHKGQGQFFNFFVTPGTLVKKVQNNIKKIVRNFFLIQKLLFCTFSEGGDLCHFPTLVTLG